jgi:hypothetical protein
MRRFVVYQSKDENERSDVFMNDDLFSSSAYGREKIETQRK